jgi:hypothetical protein
MPDLMPSRRTSWLGSPAASRSFSSCQTGLTMLATGRSVFGKAAAGAPGSAVKSWAEPAPDIANTVAKLIKSVRPQRVPPSSSPLPSLGRNLLLLGAFALIYGALA